MPQQLNAVFANTEENILQDPSEFVRTDWKEAVQAYAPGGGDVFSLENSEAVLSGYIPFAKRWSFIRYVLGTATVIPYFDDTLGYVQYRLSRTPASEHPWYGWMTAHSCHLQYFKPDGTELKINAFDPDLSFDFANYVKVLATVRYKQLPWEWKPDSPTLFEYERMCFDPDRTGNLDIISRISPDHLKFVQTSPTGPQIREEFVGEVGFPIYKEQFNYKWMYVPRNWIMSGPKVAGTSNPVVYRDGFSAKQITRRLGTVNNAAFLGFAAGTLLFAGVHFERFLWPLRSVTDAPYGYNVTFNFQVFDPTPGNTTLVDGEQPFRGHNLHPYWKDGKFYYATWDGTTTGQPFLSSSNFGNLFQYVDAV